MVEPERACEAHTQRHNGKGRGWCGGGGGFMKRKHCGGE